MAQAQSFSVSSFRQLDNDATAFITPVCDLADEPCALVRVVGNRDFAFSSPLGIVKRTDLTGEILLYLPGGSRMLTVKHPAWGVLRDYQFPQKLIGQHAYELRIAEPQYEMTVLHDTITRTVIDTVTIVHERPRLPLQKIPMITAGLMQSDFALGAMLAVVRKHGAYVHAQWNLRGFGHDAVECDADGFLTDGSLPYYTGIVLRSSYDVTVGGIHRVSSRFFMFEGIGWGKSVTSWQMVGVDGSTSWVRNAAKTHDGIAIEAGAIVSVGSMRASLGVTTIAAKAWCMSVGIGI